MTALTAVVVVLDLVWTRTTARLLLPRDGLSAGVNEGLIALGGFLSHLSGLLSLALLLMALAVGANRERVFPRALQVSVVFVAALFVLLAGRALWGPLGSRSALYVKIAYAFMTLFLLLGLLRHRRWRRTAGFALIALAGVAGAAASFLDALRGAEAGATLVGRLGQALALTAALASAPLLAPRRDELVNRRAGPLAAAAGVLTAAITFTLVQTRFDLMEALGAHGLNLALVPPGTPGSWLFQVTFALAAASVVHTLVACAGGSPPLRLVGYGLLLTAAAGYAPGSPSLLAASLLGAVAIVVGVTRMPGPVNLPNEKGRQRAERAHQDVQPRKDGASSAP